MLIFKIKMKKQSLILNIPDPCTIAWDDMAPANGGRFCAQCQKNVVDFSAMTDAEILAVISKGEKVCGRFKPVQLNRTLVAAAPSKRTFLPAAIMASFIAAIIPDSSKAQKPAVDTTILPSIKKGEEIKKELPDLFTGRIVDSLSQQGLPGVVISLSGLQVITDAEGKFQLNIPAALKGQPLTLKTNYIGYEGKCISLGADQLTTPVKIDLQPASTIGLGEVVLVGAVTPRRRTWWQKITGVFRK